MDPDDRADTGKVNVSMIGWLHVDKVDIKYANSDSCSDKVSGYDKLSPYVMSRNWSVSYS